MYRLERLDPLFSTSEVPLELVLPWSPQLRLHYASATPERPDKLLANELSGHMLFSLSLSRSVYIYIYIYICICICICVYVYMCIYVYMYNICIYIYIYIYRHIEGDGVGPEGNVWSPLLRRLSWRGRLESHLKVFPI